MWLFHSIVAEIILVTFVFFSFSSLWRCSAICFSFCGVFLLSTSLLFTSFDLLYVLQGVFQFLWIISWLVPFRRDLHPFFPQEVSRFFYYIFHFWYHTFTYLRIWWCRISNANKFKLYIVQIIIMILVWLWKSESRRIPKQPGLQPQPFLWADCHRGCLENLSEPD